MCCTNFEKRSWSSRIMIDENFSARDVKPRHVGREQVHPRTAWTSGELPCNVEWFCKLLRCLAIRFLTVCESRSKEPRAPYRGVGKATTVPCRVQKRLMEKNEQTENNWYAGGAARIMTHSRRCHH
ncbi:hypothetical protein HBI56_080960 [Parastagonospora nodorum]|uniref:Uncharacterized protein n=1 Tax=Phaeosphaeria nodorum (strain SN15 / ATCC MYA-4574 / FGSC 10173) TaxID=321614 RepID=A0A7U2FKC1_PHANO|nr:hypothetical protein HBH56_105740 [Parastagonospora nodorum]QRD04781.1 hypothetical protein JI435_421680 [Parastagonospora nodorum SN15]KAH3929537.1 hypothetical protein HBH54_124670 [Parastagonospora nodorum]KAH3951671.1 hypothetical protein HBH53_058670 [Parastagonospora nodorum]KAH3975655.1 hypothetical protein HBH52_128200 [Parastagonospora nodorum]